MQWQIYLLFMFVFQNYKYFTFGKTLYKNEVSLPSLDRDNRFFKLPIFGPTECIRMHL